jgi:hypothetical protein
MTVTRARQVPAVFYLSSGARNGTHCVWCALPLGDDAVPAGIAVGYWGAHNRSITVLACPPCATTPGEAS